LISTSNALRDQAALDLAAAKEALNDYEETISSSEFTAANSEYLSALQLASLPQ